MQKERTLLFVDTLTQKAGLTISRKGKLYQARFGERREYSRDLIRVFESALKKARISVDDLEGVVVLTGPGSYTSIRIGVSFANAFGYAKQIPICGVSLFGALIYDTKRPLVVDAGRGNVFYRSGKKEGIWTLEEAVKKKHVVGFELEGLDSAKLDVASVLGSAHFTEDFKPVMAHYVTQPTISKPKKK